MAEKYENDIPKDYSNNGVLNKKYDLPKPNFGSGDEFSQDSQVLRDAARKGFSMALYAIGHDINANVKNLDLIAYKDKRLQDFKSNSSNYYGGKTDRWVILEFTNEQNGIEEVNELFFDEIYIDVNFKNEYVKTPIIGKIGTIKEKLYGSDFQIRLSGSFTNTNRQTNFKNALDYVRIQELRRLLIQSTKIEVQSKLLNEGFQVFQLIVEDCNINENKTYRNVVDFSMTCYSTEDIYTKSENTIKRKFFV